MNRATGFKCAAVRNYRHQPADAGLLSSSLARHTASCLRCQAHIARHRRLQRELSGLAALTERAPASLLPRVEHSLSVDAPVAPGQSRTRRALAAVAGASAAAASVVAVALWRRTRLAA